MAKQKVEKRGGTIEDLPDILKEIGRDAWERIEGTAEQKTAKRVAMVRDKAKDRGITFEQSDGTLKQYIDKVRGDLGWANRRTRSGAPAGGAVDQGEPTLTELVKARELISKHGGKLTDILKDIQTFGSVERLRKCVEGLERLQVAR